MAKLACLLLGIGLASAGVIFPVPDPYRWDESFTVEMPQIDDEHRGLFNGILLVERENTQENLEAATIKYHDHFTFEEGLFKQTMSDDYIEDHLGVLLCSQTLSLWASFPGEILPVSSKK